MCAYNMSLASGYALCQLSCPASAQARVAQLVECNQLLEEVQKARGGAGSSTDLSRKPAGT